ncbi:MAG: hypothetical protein LBP89_09595 [Helicobacteraceae bacterium]|jgi:hypothetical protein|nr:hypothetical protein [Helicobacteraceae bacterium]
MKRKIAAVLAAAFLTAISATGNNGEPISSGGFLPDRADFDKLIAEALESGDYSAMLDAKSQGDWAELTGLLYETRR